MPGLKTRPPSDPESVDRWLDALVARHTASLTRPEFLKAVRALSARYVEARGRLPERSPLDSAGKRAAFAAFYAPLHFVATREIVRALGPGATTLEIILDLGCGTGVASAAWGVECARPPMLHGIDTNAWTLTEAAWNWRQFGLPGRTRRGDLVSAAEDLARPSFRRPLTGTAALLGWSVNELDDARRRRLLTALTHIAGQGGTILVIEPIARSVTPWWTEWLDAFKGTSPVVRTDDWKFGTALPPALDQLNDAAGFSPRVLSARSLFVRS